MPLSIPISPQAAASAIVEHDGRFLLVKRRFPPAADLYAFPGGRSEPGETPEQTAVRELFEETGLTGHNPRLFAFYDIKGEADGDHPASHFLLSVFKVDIDEYTSLCAGDDAAEAGWFDLDEIAGLPAPPSVIECVEKLARERQDG